MGVSEALVESTRKLYSVLEENATVEKAAGGEFQVFRGSIVEKFSEAGLSRSYYSRIVSFLADNGCITYLQKGTKHFESVIILHKPPDFDGMELAPLTGPGRYDKLEAELNVIKKQLGGLDILKVLEEFDRRLRIVESRKK